MADTDITAADSQNRKKVLFWVESRFGAGHINLVSAFSQELSKQGYDVHVLTSATGYAKNANLDKYATIHPLPGYLIEQPDYKSTVGADFDPKRNQTIYGKEALEDEEWKKQREDIIKKTVDELKPDFFITESWPTNRGPLYDPELLNTVKHIKEKLPDTTKIMSVLLDIVFTREPLIKDPAGGNDKEAARIAKEYFESILVMGDPRIVKIQESAPFLKGADNIVYVGPYMQIPEGLKKDDRPFKDRPVIVSTGGGFGVEGEQFLKNAILARGYSKELGQNPWKVYISKDCTDVMMQELQSFAVEQGGTNDKGET